MKKKLLLLLLIITSLLIALYFYRYKSVNIIKNHFPENTKAVVSINLRQLENKIFWDVLSNPSLYLSSKPKKKSNNDAPKSKKSFNFFKNVTIPKNIQFYSQKEDLDEWYSSIITIKKNINLEQFLIDKGFVQEKSNSNFNVFRKKAIAVIINSNKVILSILPENNTITLKNLFLTKKLVNAKSKIIKKLKSNKNDLLFVSDNEMIKLNFLNGEIDFGGNMNLDFLSSQKNSISPTSTLTFNCNINKESDFIKKAIQAINKTKFTKLAQLNFDTIYKHWNGTMQFNLKEFTTKIDNIKTYEYDDDFNQTEVTSTQKIAIPSFDLSLNTTKNLLPYFKQQNTITDIENKTIFKQIPLIETQIIATDSLLSLFSTTKSKAIKTETLSKLFIQFSAFSYRKYTKGTIYHISNTEKIDYFNFAISKNDNIYGTVKMMGKSRNSFAQLIK
ncbi:MAG: hypothetical protein V3U80_07745 [Flavobacteriaceae bacterium]